MSTMTEDERRIAERYPARRRPWLWPLVALPLVALLAYWLYVSAFHANPDLQGKVTAYKVVSDTETQVKVMADRRTPQTTGRCLVFIQSADFERVGELWAPVTAAQKKVDEQWVTVRTFRRGTSASVDHCVSD